MDAKHTGKIYGINGPVIYLKGRTGFKMSEMVYVGEERLVGEVISLDKDRTTIQVYEETSGLKPGEIVEGTGDAVSVSSHLELSIIFSTELNVRWKRLRRQVMAHLLQEVSV